MAAIGHPTPIFAVTLANRAVRVFLLRPESSRASGKKVSMCIQRSVQPRVELRRAA